MNEKIVKIALLALLLLAVIVFFAIDFLFGGFQGAAVAPATAGSFSEATLLAEFSAENPSSFYPAGEAGYFEVTKDGVKYFSDGHKEQAAMSFSMTQPVVVNEGNILCIFEHKGTVVHVFSDQGALYTLQLEAPILNVAVNGAGYASVITQDNEAYALYAYNENGELIKSGLQQEPNVFPIAADIADDGSLWAISYLDINGVQMNSKITYVSLLAADSLDYRDGIVASNADNPDELISRVHFMDGNRLLAVSDKKISCTDTADLFKQTFAISLGNTLDHIGFDGKSGFAVALGDGVLNETAEPPGLVRYYSLDGAVQWTYQGGRKISFLDARYGAAIVGEGRNFSAFSDRGELLFSFSPMQDIRQMFFFQDTANIIQVSNQKTTVNSLEKAAAATAGQ